MIASPIARSIQMRVVPSCRQNRFLISSSRSLWSTIGRSTVGALASRSYSNHRSYQHTRNEAQYNDYFLGMGLVAATATAGISLKGTSSSLPQTLCEESQTDQGEALEVEPEGDPYDDLPEEDEPTHCSICLTYRKGPCRPYWRKVEACTKDTEKEKKKQEGTNGEKGENKKDDDSSSPMSESTRCFKYMMPWIDCASGFRNLYTLIELYTNYTEGIKDLEATSLHFCWVPGQEPKIDWSNWQQSGIEEKERVVDSAPTEKTDNDTNTDLVTNAALWQTFDPALGDPKLITVEAKVPATINSGLGIMECAYAVDQDNNVLGFAYGTKPSDLIDADSKKADEDEGSKTAESTEDEKKSSKNEKVDENGNVTLNIQLVPSRTKKIVLSASYTHLIEVAKSKNEEGNNHNAIESHLYKSKPFVLVDIPKLDSPAPPEDTDNSTDGDAGESSQVS